MIDSTIDFQSVDRTIWDVVVIGAGPAGSVAALQLARSGVSVLMVDKAEHPRSKVCGCCLSAASVKLLDSLGLKERLLQLNAVAIDKIVLNIGSHRAAVGLCPGLAISRQVLDSELIKQAIAAGANFVSQTTAFVEAEANDHRVVELQCKNFIVSARAKCVIVADGLSGHSLDRLQLLPTKAAEGSRIGAGTTARAFPSALFDDGCIYMTAGDGGYVGMVKIEDGSLDVAAAFDRSFVQKFKSPGHAANELIKLTPFAQFDLSSLQWHGTPALTRKRKVAASRLLVVGDAASYAEPFTGEGMLWAMTSGCAVVPMVLKSLEYNRGGFRYSQWEDSHRRLIEGKQLMSMSLALMLRRPGLIELMIRILNTAPFMAKPIVEALGHQPALPAMRYVQSATSPRV